MQQRRRADAVQAERARKAAIDRAEQERKDALRRAEQARRAVQQEAEQRRRAAAAAVARAEQQRALLERHRLKRIYWLEQTPRFFHSSVLKSVHFDLQPEVLGEAAYLELPSVQPFVDPSQQDFDRDGWDASVAEVCLEMASKELQLKLAVFAKVAAADPRLEPLAPTFATHPPSAFPLLPPNAPPRPPRTLLEPITEEQHCDLDAEFKKLSHQLTCKTCRVVDAYPDILYHVCDPASPGHRLPRLSNLNQRYPSSEKLCDLDQLEVDPRRVTMVKALLKVVKMSDKRGLNEESKMRGRWSCGECWNDPASLAVGIRDVPFALDVQQMASRLFFPIATDS